MKLPVCFNAHKVPSEKVSKGVFLFHYRADPLSKGGKNNLDKVACFESLAFLLKAQCTDAGDLTPDVKHKIVIYIAI